MRIVILLMLCCFLGSGASAQDKSNRGKEFWLAYGFDYSFFNESPINNQELAIYISAEQAATVTVTVSNTGYSQTLNIPANTADASILIPKSGPNDARTLTDGLNNRGIHIVSDVPVAVYAHVYSTQVSGATMLMPVETNGYLYHSINYYQTTSQSSPGDWYSWFYAIASEDNTRLEITPSDTTKNGWLPGQTYTVNLNKGESYHVFGKAIFNNNPAFASKDMTGSKILSVVGADGSCHPFALFSGSGGIRLCRGDGGEFVHQQVFPAQAWGTRYLTYHTINNTNTDILETNRNFYRVCVSDPATVVKKNGVVMTGLIKNFFYEYMDSTGGDYIEADKPILVAQYTPNKNQCWNYPVTTPAPPSYGDPEMFYLSPIEQGQKSVLFYVSRKSSIDYVYANIHLPTAAVASLKVDGVSLPASQVIPHPNLPSYSVALARFVGPAAQHTIVCDSTFTSTVYGLGNYESYGYNVGTLINNLNYYSAIRNTYNSNGQTDTFTCRNTPVRLFVKVGYPATAITWKLSQVSGISPNADSIINNPVPAFTEQINGRTYYTYTLQQDFSFSNTGTFYIPVSYSAAVIQNCNQTEQATVKVVVKPGPTADFTVSANNCLKDTLLFTSASTTAGFNITTYLWNFDDATTQNTINAKKKFLTPGIQNVRYRIYADNGCAGDTTKQITINPTPLANFGATSSICSSDSVRITDTCSISAGTISSWNYNFGDGNNLIRNTNTAFYHKYILPGSYTIKLVATSNNGCQSDTAYRSVTVFANPVSKFGYDRNICAGDSIKFSDSSSIASGLITNRHWNFGDGNTADRNNATPFYHQYLNSGNYIVYLVTVSDRGCLSDTFRLTVRVNNKPLANINFAGTPCKDSSFLFTSSFVYNASTPANWYWNFGDGNTTSISTTNTVSHAYTTALNNITVKHVVDLGGGCVSDTAIVLIPLISNNPVAAYSIKIDTLCENIPLQFSSPLTGVASWSWNFGNGTGNGIPPFSRNYSNAGTYNISLVVKNSAGCGSAPLVQTIKINPVPKVNAGADKFISTGSSIVMDASVSPASSYSYLWTPGIYLNNSSILNPLFTAGNTTSYTLKVSDNISHCFAEDDVTINVISKLFIPNAFTPNNDGKNDRWQIPGLALYRDAVVTVFNRYGQMIFQGKEYANNPWDGSFKGTGQVNGTYVYLINLNDDKNQVLKGTVMIIR